MFAAIAAGQLRADNSVSKGWDPICLKAEQIVQEGDLVFTAIPNYLFEKVADGTGSWTSHVGIVFKDKDGKLIVAESKVPKVKETPFCAFLKRSKKYKYEIRRYRRPLASAEVYTMQLTAQTHFGKLYDLGFNLDSNRMFCSKFVFLLYQSIGIPIGNVQTFQELLQSRPQTDLSFWRFWYLGRIPWTRRTVTPASVLADPSFNTVMAGDL